jgi:regulator of nucleoside diphosphate kinase
MSDMPEICVTASDRRLLGSLLAEDVPVRSWAVVEFLVRELLRAAVVSDAEVPPDVVTMGSSVRFRAAGDRVATLVYPQQSGSCRDALSVLTPLGAALLGLSVGQADVLFQPQSMRRTAH